LTFKDNHTAAFALAFGAAISVTVVIEIIRAIRHRRHPAEAVLPTVASTSSDVEQP
jgi:hypothetical protein